MKPGSMCIKFEYRIDSRVVKCFSLTGSISTKYHAPIRILPKVKYVFYFLFFFFFDRGKINERWPLLFFIDQNWMEIFRCARVITGFSFLPFSFFSSFLFRISFLKARFYHPLQGNAACIGRFPFCLSANYFECA